MKTISELTDFYYKNLHPILQDLDNERKKVKSRVIYSVFIFTLFTLLIAFVLSSYHVSFDIFVFLVFGYIAGIGMIYKFLSIGYRSHFKEKIMKPLISELDDTLTYSPHQHIPSHYFTNSKIFTSRIDRINGDDLVCGSIDGVHLEFSDLEVEKKIDNIKNNKEEYITIFKGLFIVSEFNKNFFGQTVILPDTAQSSFGNFVGNFLQSHNIARDELVKMDNVEFEKEFVVYSNNQIEARYILTPSLMEKILHLKKRTKHPIYLSFINKNIHIAISYKKNLFEPSIFESLLKHKVAMEYIETLHIATSIVEELKLNQKLWSKR